MEQGVCMVFPLCDSPKKLSARGVEENLLVFSTVIIPNPTPATNKSDFSERLHAADVPMRMPRSAIKSQHMFDLMHLGSAIKVAERKG
jgi:hypothetical protein